METVREQRVWASPDSLDFFTRQRQTPDDLYPSERIFLPDAVSRADNVLDVGCACGGFAAIMQTFNKDIAYTGVDIVPEMLARAERDNGDAIFAAATGHELPFANRAFDLVHCSGATHLNSLYRELIADMWRVTRNELLFDMRLSEGESQAGHFRVNFSGGGDEQTLPYFIVNLDEVKEIINTLDEPPGTVRLAGYRHPASGNADFEEGTMVIMAFLLLQRNGDHSGWQIEIEGEE